MTKEDIINEFNSLSDEDKAAVINEIGAAAIAEVKSKGITAWVLSHWKAIATGAVAIGAGIGGLFGLTSCTITPEQAAAARMLQGYIIKIESSDVK